ncbi:MAG: hypothetical protein M2R45_05259 [Verrucomicrobia subdivision 3 bacterium]|nr:hypothetical protein [Limisphaerales bacterium]MCS1416857.1 hypothetical protein [Limisphaerales bacterium]
MSKRCGRNRGCQPVPNHLKNSQRICNHLVDKVRGYDRQKETAFREARNYEGLEMHVVEHLFGSEIRIKA